MRFIRRWKQILFPALLLFLVLAATLQAQDPMPAVGGPDTGIPNFVDEDVLQLATSPDVKDIVIRSDAGSQIPSIGTLGGRCWRPLASAPWQGEDADTPIVVAVTPRTYAGLPYRVIAAVPSNDSEIRGIYRSGDNGLTWERTPLPVLSGCGFPIPSALVVSPVDAKRLYLTVWCSIYDMVGVYMGAGLYTSADAGINWEFVSHHDLSNKAVLPSPVVDGRLYLRDWGESPSWWQSDDHGETWIEKDWPNAPGDLLALDPNDPNRLYGISFSPTGMWSKISKDGGETWEGQYHDGTCSDSSVGQLLASTSESDILLLRCDQGYFRSTDGGISWQLRFQPSPNGIMAPDYGNPGRVIWAMGGLFESTDSGDGWSRLIWWDKVTCPQTFLPEIIRSP